MERTLSRSYRNRRGRIVEPTHSKKKGAKRKETEPIRQVPTSEISAEVACNAERLELGVGLALGGHRHPLSSEEAHELAHTFIAWLGFKTDLRLDFPLDDEGYSVDREGAFRLAVLVAKHATVADVLNALIAYKMETEAVDRSTALGAVKKLYDFCASARYAEVLEERAAA